ncbi:sulfurtransferase TusA family protein [Tessaracoccus sp. SD287]|uniref:sulfurtransferase TusA family protein n=1 Tax=Tessaracoccus sp. SD287 TaxID=2782008 RepID=UPI001A95A036|nr:sulfurtransferase TusA family protein [Tessaracoccus sp. SD287]MBO1032340.1 sulfurtransferase TusA family protein [Tessaracoccus sp. SD287]
MAFLDNLFKKDQTASAVSPIDLHDANADAPVAGKRYRLDTLGQVCPFPLVEAKQAIQGLEKGDELVIDFDCTQATDSIPNWAAAAGYPVTHFEQVGDAEWTITVKKA